METAAGHLIPQEKTKYRKFTHRLVLLWDQAVSPFWGLANRMDEVLAENRKRNKFHKKGSKNERRTFK
jgi:hypothetical protein